MIKQTSLQEKDKDFLRTHVGLKEQLLRGATGTFGLKVAGTGLTFLSSVVLARVLGAEQYGIYAYAMALVMVLSIPAKMGADEFLIREIAVFKSHGEWSLLKGLLRWADILVVLFSTILGIGCLAVGMALLSRGGVDSIVMATFFAGLLILPLNSLNAIRQAALRGLNHVVLGQVPELIFRQVFFLLLIAGAYFAFREMISPPWMMIFNAVAGVGALVFGGAFLRRSLPSQVFSANPSYEVRKWLGYTFPFMLIGGMYIVNNRADVIMLGSMKGPEAAGIYTVAARGAELISFVWMAINTPLAPVVASMYRQNEREKLQQVVTKCSRAALFATLPLALILIFGGELFLRIFGEEFTTGRTALAILILGRLIHAAAGTSGVLLNMTGNERLTALGFGFGVIANLVLNFLLIPVWGIVGAAVATMTSTILWNLMHAYWARKKLKLNPMAFF